MPPHTQVQRVLDLVSRKGMLRTGDLDNIEVPRVVLTRMVDAGLLEKVDRTGCPMIRVQSTRA